MIRKATEVFSIERRARIQPRTRKR
jgi:hypothetical protein